MIQYAGDTELYCFKKNRYIFPQFNERIPIQYLRVASYK